jgi:hypothetical protein
MVIKTLELEHFIYYRFVVISRRNTMKHGLIWLFLAITSIGIVVAEEGSVPDGTISGYAYNADTKQPLSQAWVYCQEVECPKQVTDAQGHYSLEGCFSPLTAYKIMCAKYGYDTSTEIKTTDDKGRAQVNFFITNKSKNMSLSWEKTFGGSNDDWGGSVQQTSDGGYILTGRTASYSAGSSDVWLIKTDANGKELWSKTFGGSEYDECDAVQQTSDGGYILTGGTGSYGAGEGDVWLIKTDANGKELWSKTFGGSKVDWGSSVQQTSDGGYILTGITASYGIGGSDVWLIKTDANGKELWSKTLEGSNRSSVQQTMDDGYIITGMIRSYGAGEPDVWLIKTGANGKELWSKTFGGSKVDWGSSVQKTSDGGYIIIGSTYSYGAGDRDVWLIKTDANGKELWSKTFGGSREDDGWSVQQTSDGGYIIAGYTASYVAGDRDVWLIKTDANGKELWSKTFGGSKGDWGGSVQQTSDGGYIIIGSTYSYGAGESDVWLIKTDGNGNHRKTTTLKLV